jgi:hypothetical protein
MPEPDAIEREMGLVRPLRLSYAHVGCAARKNGTTVSRERAIEMARAPEAFQSAELFCSRCRGQFPADQFRWYNPDGTISDEAVGS